MSRNKQSNQAGVASILITMIMMIVITLIVVGFAQVVGRNQRETLDKQLSTQAYYAAETGVNDAIAKIKADVAAGNGITAQNNCSGTYYPSSTNLDGNNAVGYSCVMVASKPSNIGISQLSAGDSQVVSLTPSGDTGGLTFSWNPSGSGSYTGCSDPNASGYPFSSTTAWTSTCPYSLLRVDLYQYNTSGGGVNVFNSNPAAGLDSQVVTMYILPSQSGAQSSVSPIAFGTHNAYIFYAGCNNSTCSVTVNGTSGNSLGANNTAYYARISSVYEDSHSVTVSAVNSGVTFTNDQLVIDVTGKAQDELRRIQVRVPFTGGGSPDPLQPNFALATTNSIGKN